MFVEDVLKNKNCYSSGFEHKKKLPPDDIYYSCAVVEHIADL